MREALDRAPRATRQHLPQRTPRQQRIEAPEHRDFVFRPRYVPSVRRNDLGARLASTMPAHPETQDTSIHIADHRVFQRERDHPGLRLARPVKEGRLDALGEVRRAMGDRPRL
jgi:hypothetical protein